MKYEILYTDRVPYRITTILLTNIKLPASEYIWLQQNMNNCIIITFHIKRQVSVPRITFFNLILSYLCS